MRTGPSVVWDSGLREMKLVRSNAAALKPQPGAGKRLVQFVVVIVVLWALFTIVSYLVGSTSVVTS